ncbi:MAG: phosphatidate cytidylyltransferase [Fimbriimonadaceae bacterium]
MRARLITAFIAMPLVILALNAPTVIPLALLCLMASLLAGRELAKLFRTEGASVMAPVGIAIVAALAFWMPQVSALAVACAAAAVGGGALIYAVANRKPWLGTWAGILWIGAAFLATLVAHRLPGQGDVLGWSWRPVLALFFPLWAGDSAALFFGKRFGKRPVWPELSPNKTWEGFFAQFIASVVVGATFAPLWTLSYWQGALIGLVAGLLGPTGDFLQSYAKRSVGLKDTGDLLPGHGGLLDRLDSFFLTAPVVALLLVLFRGGL